MPGGAQAILATPPSSKAMSRLIDGLAPKGKLMVIGEAIQGYVSGTPTDSEDTPAFAELIRCQPMTRFG